MKICVSDRCFFPLSAFINSKKTVKLAKNLGYRQVEFHPTWVVWLEALLKGKLGCRSEDISSFHISWREDGIQSGFGFFKRNFLIPAFRLFPPEPWGTKSLQKLEKKYKKPVVVHWRQDFNKFKSPLLELHGLLEMNWSQIEKEITRERIKGIVIDTDKFSDWIKQTGEDDQVLSRLFPYITEVHFRFRHKEDIDPISGRKETKSSLVMKRLLKMGYKGRVVVEMGWPDIGSIEVLKKQGLKKIHEQIVKFLKNL